MTRKKVGNGESSIYFGTDGSWHGRVTVGIKDDGRADRRHVRGTTRAAVAKKVRALEESRRAGNVQEAGVKWTVGQWLDHWLENIAKPSVRENSYSGYRVDVNVHLKPAVGGQKLRNLAPEHLERLYVSMQKRGKAAATAHHVHRTVRTALGEAERRGYISRNPAALVRPPRLHEEEVDPLSVDDVQRLLKVVADRRNSARWAIALSLGLRQGEALGLKWADIDLDIGSLAVRRSRLRPKWAHGCGGTCNRKHGGYCPQRMPLRKATAETKSRAGRRVIGLPDELVKLLKAHRQRQDAERAMAEDLWNEGGWVFATHVGNPVNPRTDYTEWKAILNAANLRDVPLHGARHTAATVLLLLGVPDRAVMGLMGWTKVEMLAKYQHLTGTVRRDIADRLGALLWDSPGDDSDSS